MTVETQACWLVMIPSGTVDRSRLRCKSTGRPALLEKHDTRASVRGDELGRKAALAQVFTVDVSTCARKCTEAQGMCTI